MRRSVSDGTEDPGEPSPLAPHDAAIWRTVHLNDLLDAGGLSQFPAQATYFPPSLGDDEKVVAAGPFELRSVNARRVTTDSGQVAVSNLGVYLQSPAGLLPWGWAGMTAAQLVAPRQLWVTGQVRAARGQWILESDWAELVFTLWARARHPDHPQFLDCTWVPEGWAERITAASYALPVSHSGRWNQLGLEPGPGG